jgi:hypothetical protein
MVTLTDYCFESPMQKVSSNKESSTPVCSNFDLHFLVETTKTLSVGFLHFLVETTKTLSVGFKT